MPSDDIHRFFKIHTSDRNYFSQYTNDSIIAYYSVWYMLSVQTKFDRTKSNNLFIVIQDVGVFKTKFKYKKDGEGNNTKPHICEKIYLEEKNKK